MADAAAFDPTSVRIYNLPATPRAQMLSALQRYGTGEQWDHLDIDWTGRRRDAWTPHAIERLRAVGVWTIAAAANVHKRPNAPVPLAGLVVEGFSDILLGEGREPAVKVDGDPDTEAALEAVFSTSETWDALAEARDQIGRCGCAGFLPVLEDGVPSAQVLNAAHLAVLEWEATSAWIPRVVVEQKLVTVPITDEDGIRREVPAWRTRAWDQVYEYLYEDLLLDDAPRRDSETQSDYERRRLRADESLTLKGKPIEHKAGRCPVVWIQNVRDSECPDSCADYDQQSLELMDAADKLQSMLVRGSIANVDPTLCISDFVWADRFWPTREKGYGKIIKTSESGSAKLLEISGQGVEQSRKTLQDVIMQIEHRCGIVIIDPDTAGSYRSGEALGLLWRRMEQKAGRKRRSLTRAVRQIAKIWLDILGAVKIGNVELPPRTVPAKDGGEPKVLDQKLGKSRWITIDWPPYNYPTPAQLLSTAQALSIAAGGKQIISEETATGWMLGTMGRTDPQRERKQIDSEQQARVDALDDELEAGLGERGDDDVETPPPAEPVETIQDMGVAGAQGKFLLDLLAAAGTSLAPRAAVILLSRTFKGISRADAQTMVDEQVAFIDNGDCSDRVAPLSEDPDKRAQELAVDTGDQGEDDDGSESDEFAED